MADAEIIPLGTRGRPGRGTGTERPSARSRNLAGNGKTGRASSGAAPADAVGAPHEPATTEPTSPTVSAGRAPDEGIPVEEILAAVLAAARETFGDDGERRLAHVLAFLRRRVTGDYEVDEFGLDPHLTTNLFFNAIRPLAEKWFRVEVRGLENLPRDGGALIVGNHSGTLPVDGLVTAFVIHEATGRFLRLLGADLVFRMPFVGEIARRGGVTLACVDDACRLLHKGELVGVWPEGYKGIGKQFIPALPAPALRSGRLRCLGHQHRGTDRPLLDRRRRGDLPAHRGHPRTGPAAGPPVLPGHTAVPAAGTAGHDPAAVEVDHRVR